MSTRAQIATIVATFNGLGIKDRAERLQVSSEIVGREITSGNDLTRHEASTLIDTLRTVEEAASPADALHAILTATDAAKDAAGEQGALPVDATDGGAADA